MKYTKASARVVLFDNSDVITTSGELCLDGIEKYQNDSRPCESASHQSGVVGCGYSAQWL